MTQNYAESRIIDAVVFIDGIEVPFSSLKVSFGLDRPSTLTIMLEPDEIIDTWRPKSWVHVFIRDPFDPRSSTKQPVSGVVRARDADFDQLGLLHYWEGEVVAIQDTESSEQRVTAIFCVDLWSIPQNVPTELAQIGAGIQIPALNGTTFYGSLLDPAQTGAASKLIVDSLAALLFQAPAAGEQAVTPDRIGRVVLEYFGGFNASYALQLVRTDMLAKMAGLNDRSADLLVRFALMQSMMRNMQGMQPGASVLDYMNELIGKFLYHFTTVGMPSTQTTELTADPASTGPFPTFTGGKQIYKSLCILPNLYYAIPPMCNWLFPDQYSARSVSRNFMNEPTRLGLQSSAMFLNGLFVHLAPESLDRYFRENGVSSADPANTGPEKIYGTKSTSDTKSIDPAELDLNKRGLKSGDQNLLKFLLPSEVEKGVLYRLDSNAYQELLVGAALFNGELDPTDPQVHDKAIQRYSKANEQSDPYPAFMRQLAQYQLLLRQNSRNIEVSGPFNPWPVVGLPMLLLRQGRSYRALLTGLDCEIDYSGRALTSYTLDFAFLLRTSQTVKAKDYTKAIEKFSAVDARIIDTETALKQIQDSVAFTEAEKAKLKDSPAANKLAELQGKAEVLRQKDALIKSFMTEFEQLRRNLALTNNAPFVDSYAIGLMECVGFFTAASKISPRSAEFSGGSSEGLLQALAQVVTDGGAAAALAYARGFSAGSKYSELAELITQALPTVPLPGGGTSGQSRAGGFAALAINMVVFAVTTIDRLSSMLAQPQPHISSGSTVAARTQLQAGMDAFRTASNATEQAKAQTLIANADAVLKQPTADVISFVRSVMLALGKPSTTATTTLHLVVKSHARGQTLTNTFDFSLAKFLSVSGIATSSGNGLLQSTMRSIGGNFNSLDLYKNTGDQPWLEPEPSLQLAAVRPQGDSLLLAISNAYLAVTNVQLTNLLQETISAIDAAVEAVRGAYEVAQRFVTGSEMEIPPVTAFSNADFLDIRKVDEAYAGIVAPANSQRGPEIQNTTGDYTSRLDSASDSFEIRKKAAALQVDPQRDNALLYSEFVNLVSKVFPLSSETDSTNPTEWERAKAAGKVHEWANNLQARRGTTLGTFLAINNLRLVVETVQTPLGASQFYRMADNVPAGGGELVERGARSFFSKFGNKDSATLKEELDELRRLAIKEGGRPDWRWALAPARQQLILSYARKHFAVGAFAGKR